MTTFSEEWVRTRVASELEAIGAEPSALTPFPELEGFERHFVMGADKRGTLWTLESAFLDANEKRVFVAVRYHAAAVHLGATVHGGAISAIVDAFAAACGMMQLGWDMRAVTKEQTLHFRKGLKLETPYLVMARASASPTESAGAHVVTAIVGEDGKTRIDAETLMVIPNRG